MKKQIFILLFYIIAQSTISCSEIPISELTREECQKLNFTDYTEKMIYYAQAKDQYNLRHLYSNARMKNRRETGEIQSAYGISLINIYGENSPYRKGEKSILEYAAEVDSIASFRLYLHFNPNADVDFALHFASKTQRNKVTKVHTYKPRDPLLTYLLSTCTNINVNVQDDEKKAPLHHIAAAKDDNAEFCSEEKGDLKYEENIRSLTINIQSLLNHPNIEINAQDIHGNTPLHYAINHKFIDYFLDRSTLNLNIKNNSGETPLHYFIQHPSITIRRRERKRDRIEFNDYYFECLLQDSRTDVNAQNNDGESPLHYTTKHTCLTLKEFYDTRVTINNLHKTELLLKHPSIIVNLVNNKGETPLDYAMKTNNQEIINLLKEHGGISGIEPNFIIKIMQTLPSLIYNLTHKQKSTNNSEFIKEKSIDNAKFIIASHLLHKPFYLRFKNTIIISSILGIIGLISTSIFAYFHYNPITP